MWQACRAVNRARRPDTYKYNSYWSAFKTYRIDILTINFIHYVILASDPFSGPCFMGPGGGDGYKLGRGHTHKDLKRLQHTARKLNIFNKRNSYVGLNKAPTDYPKLQKTI